MLKRGTEDCSDEPKEDVQGSLVERLKERETTVIEARELANPL